MIFGFICHWSVIEAPHTFLNEEKEVFLGKPLETLQMTFRPVSEIVEVVGMIATRTFSSLLSKPNTGALPAAPRPHFPFREPAK